MPRYGDRQQEGMLYLLDAMVRGSSDGLIEESEARGQQDLVNSSDLPIDQNRGPTLEEISDRTGIVFGEKINDLFIEVQLPAGWTKKATDHSMWSELLDQHGRERASIFYKAALYDRSAHMHWSRFFNVQTRTIDGQGRERYKSDDFDRSTGEDHYYVENANGETVHQVAPVMCWDSVEDRDERQRLMGLNDEASKECREWLAQNHPDWDDPFAYWDEPPATSDKT